MTASEGFRPYIELVEDLLRPLIEATEDFDAAEDLLRELGYAPPSQVLAFGELSGVANAVADLIDGLRDAIDADDQDGLVQQLVRLLPEVGQVVQAINGFHSKIQQNFPDSPFLTQTDILAAIPRKLTDYLIVKYLEDYRPTVFAALLVGGVIDLEDIEDAPTPFHTPYLQRSVNWVHLPQLLSDPVGSLKGNLDGGDELLYDRLLFLLYRLGLAIGLLPIFAAPHPAILSAFNRGRDVSALDEAGELDILYFPVIGDPTFGVGFEVYPLVDVATSKYTGLALAIRAGTHLEIPLSDAYRLEITASANVRDGLGIRIPREGDVSFISNLFSSPSELAAATAFSVKFSIVPTALGPTSKLVALSAPAGTRVEVGSASLTFGVEKLDTFKLFVEADLRDGLVSFSMQEADGFVTSVVPTRGIEVPLNVGVGISSDRGLYFRGGSGLSVRLPLNVNWGGIQIQYLGLDANSKPGSLPIILTAGLSVNLGPVSVAVEDIGVQATVKIVSDRTGNLGPLDVFFGFKPPTGVGLAIDAPAVTGGGFLQFDPAREEYSGILQLEIAETVAVKAIGLLTTRLPDGSKGFSLVIIIAAEGFPPIQLGFGFTLTGIGGLLGINRTVMVDVLRNGLKNGTLGSILFPADPIRNAPQIVSDLRTVFPPVRDRHVFGPMARIAWGTPTILTLDIGLLLELPEPVRLIILGRLQTVLPDPDLALIRVRMDAIGIIDFNKEEVSLDATLYDSRILAFVLTGDMALRVNWGRQPTFVLAIGGFNPRFRAPSGFPQLARLALSLGDSDNPRLRFESYLALTSNTVQFGARFEFGYSAAGFTLAGLLAFDALFQFSPFQFIVDVGAMVALKRGSSVLMGVFLDMTVAGPTPWHIRGTATFKVLFFKVSIRFDHRFGDEAPPALPPAIDLLALVAEALGDRRNWSSALPRGEHAIVSLREPQATPVTLRVHPLAELTVRQRVVPLNLTVTRFGNVPLAAPTLFTVAASAGAAPTSMPSTPVRDAFALAQFQEMSDDEKLARPAFEQQDAGLHVAAEEAAYQYDALPDTSIAYETLIIDPTRPADTTTAPQPYVMPTAVLDAVVSLGAAGQAAIRRRGSSRYRTPELAA